MTNVIRFFSEHAPLFGLVSSDPHPRPEAPALRNNGVFAAWLRETLCDLAWPAFEFAEPVREEDDWDIAVSCEEHKFCIQVSLLEPDFPHKSEWVVTIVPEAEFNPFQRVELNRTVLNVLEQMLRKALERRKDVSIVTPNCSPSGMGARSFTASQ